MPHIAVTILPKTIYRHYDEYQIVVQIDESRAYVDKDDGLQTFEVFRYDRGEFVYDTWKWKQIQTEPPRSSWILMAHDQVDEDAKESPVPVTQTVK